MRGEPRWVFLPVRDISFPGRYPAICRGSLRFGNPRSGLPMLFCWKRISQDLSPLVWTALAGAVHLYFVRNSEGTVAAFARRASPRYSGGGSWCSNLFPGNRHNHLGTLFGPALLEEILLDPPAQTPILGS